MTDTQLSIGYLEPVPVRHLWTIFWLKANTWSAVHLLLLLGTPDISHRKAKSFLGPLLYNETIVSAEKWRPDHLPNSVWKFRVYFLDEIKINLSQAPYPCGMWCAIKNVILYSISAFSSSFMTYGYYKLLVQYHYYFSTLKTANLIF